MIEVRTNWRPMKTADLPALLAIADVVHPAYPEDAAVFEERLTLFPSGCWVLEHHPHLASPLKGEGHEGEGAPSLNALPLKGGGWGGGGTRQGDSLIGYILSHPWTYGAPPALNSLLGAIPMPPNTYYIHDIALLPQARGTGAANIVVAQLIDLAASLGLPNLSLVAVNDSVGFWQRHGFALTPIPALDAKLRSYDDAARFMTRAIGGSHATE
jgi:ribosomal protein S18 acetylase RimI-like enzyme